LFSSCRSEDPASEVEEKAFFVAFGDQQFRALNRFFIVFVELAFAGVAVPHRSSVVEIR
jgi:hypothetical protein